jgi:hypothetical protein
MREPVVNVGEYFENPLNGYREIGGTGYSWLACLLFGPIYFAVKGAWRHAIVSGILGVCTLGLSWLVYPFFARDIVNRSYLQRGWVPASDAKPKIVSTDEAFCMKCGVSGMVTLELDVPVATCPQCGRRL